MYLANQKILTILEPRAAEFYPFDSRKNVIKQRLIKYIQVARHGNDP